MSEINLGLSPGQTLFILPLSSLSHGTAPQSGGAWAASTAPGAVKQRALRWQLGQHEASYRDIEETFYRGDWVESPHSSEHWKGNVVSSTVTGSWDPLNPEPTSALSLPNDLRDSGWIILSSFAKGLAGTGGRHGLRFRCYYHMVHLSFLLSISREQNCISRQCLLRVFSYLQRLLIISPRWCCCTCKSIASKTSHHACTWHSLIL